MSTDDSTLRLAGSAEKWLIAGRYCIERELGRGGIGVVYLAHDEQLDGRPVVIKVLLEKTPGDWLARKFNDEMKALVRIDHPGVVGALDAGVMDDGRSFLVMQFIRGNTLRALLVSGPLDHRTVADILRQLGQALDAAHEAGIYHRDLKPENIMIQETGAGRRLVKVIDFGIATVKDSQDATTRQTAVAGTPYYMAPEQLAGTPSRSSDIYAVGVIAYEMLTGKVPYSPSSPYELLAMQRRGPRELPSRVRGDIPSELDRVIQRALAFDPERRQASASELAEQVALPLEGGSHGGRKPRWHLTMIGAVVAAALMAALGIERFRSSPRAPSEAVRPAPVSAAVEKRLLNYSLLVQKHRDGKPYKDPFRLPGEMLFGPDDRVRLEITSPQAGHLYLLNEGPVSRDGGTSYNILFPSSAIGDGSSSVQANTTIRIPNESWFVFDAEEGTEKLWLCWSKHPIAQLEALKRFATLEHRGAVTETEHVEAIRAFLSRQGSVRPAVTRDSVNVRTVLSGSGDVLLNRVNLEHR